MPAALPLFALLALLLLPGTAISAPVTLCWDPPTPTAGTVITGYRIYYGNTPGTYATTVNVGNTRTYTFADLAAGIYYFVVTAIDGQGNESGYSNEAGTMIVGPNATLTHYRYYYPMAGQANCAVCHVKKGTFLGGFGVRTTVGLCHSCHSQAGVGHGTPYGGKTGHPVLVNVTADASHRRPSLGFVNGTSSDKTYTHLYMGKKVVCMTCHNSHRKPNDPGRSWEFTTTSDYKAYSLQRGGWASNAYLKPVVYRSTTLWYGPVYLSDAKQYLVSPAEYDTDASGGRILFHLAQPTSAYIYVTLENDYLRNTNITNRLCLDCHITQTHMQLDCNVCHGAHNTDNLFNIRPAIRTPQGTLRAVSYMARTAMSGKMGVCVVCHTRTKYHNVTSTRPVPHYDSRDCTDCHKHRQGFPNIST